MARIVRSRSAIAALVAAVVVAIAGVSIGRAESPPNLPPIAADELLASTLSALSEPTPVSGEVHTHVDLGLPQLPTNLGGGAMGPEDLLLSDQTFEVWRSSDGVRVAQILPFAERVAVATAADAWFWDSQTFTAWHLAVPTSQAPPWPPPFGDPLALARGLLQAAPPCGNVSEQVPTTIAGRDAYVLALTPQSSSTLVGSVEVAIDAETRLPLRVQVFPRGSDTPAVQAGFSSVDFGPIDPSMFTFTPPAGATVKEISPPKGDHGIGGGSTGGDDGGGPAPDVLTFGSCFDLIVAVRVQQAPQRLRSLLPFGGALGSAMLVDRGDHAWLVAGAVSPDALAAVASQLP